jgi:hypothetical protein
MGRSITWVAVTADPAAICVRPAGAKQFLISEIGLPGEGAVVEPLPPTGAGRGSLTDPEGDRPL